MLGLEAILNRITHDTDERVKDIVEQADARCAELLASADRESAAIIEEAGRKAKEQAEVLLRRSDSLAALETRKIALTAKQELIDEVIARATAQAAVLPDLEKRALYRRLLLEHARGSEAVIFADQDVHLAKDLLAAINAEKGWKLTVSDVSSQFSGGFILQQGLIETNLTPEVLARSLRSDLVGLAAKALFGT